MNDLHTIMPNTCVAVGHHKHKKGGWQHILSIESQAFASFTPSSSFLEYSLISSVAVILSSDLSEHSGTRGQSC